MKRIIVFLIVFCALFSFMSWAQTTQPPPIPVDYTFPLDNNGAVMNLAGGWTAQDLAASQLPTLAPLIWGALNKISLPVWQTWTVIKDPPFLNSWSCASSLEVNGTIVATNGFTNWTPTTNDLTSIAHEMSLAMFTPCSLMMADGYDYDYSLVEGQARAKAYVSDLYQQFESACDQLNLELVPYGHALREMASKKFEKHLQTLAAEPLEQAHA